MLMVETLTPCHHQHRECFSRRSFYILVIKLVIPGCLTEHAVVQVFHFSESKDKEDQDVQDDSKQDDAAQGSLPQEASLHAHNTDKKSS